MITRDQQHGQEHYHCYIHHYYDKYGSHAVTKIYGISKLPVVFFFFFFFFFFECVNPVVLKSTGLLLSSPGLERFPFTSLYDNPPHALLNIHNSSRARPYGVLVGRSSLLAKWSREIREWVRECTFFLLSYKMW